MDFRGHKSPRGAMEDIWIGKLLIWAVCLKNLFDYRENTMIKGLCYCTANEDLNESNDIGYEKGKEVKDFIKITDLIQGQEKGRH